MRQYLPKLPLSDKFKLSALGAISLITYSSAIMNVLSAGPLLTFDSLSAPVYTHVAVKEPLTVAAFKAQVEQASRDDLLIVVLRRNDCAVCPSVSMGLEEARYRLMKKTNHGFSVIELNAEQNPEIAALMLQRDPQAPARLHGFYKGEKIYESLGISDDPRTLSEVLEMVQALAYGEVSIYDKYQPSRIFDAPNP